MGQVCKTKKKKLVGTQKLGKCKVENTSHQNENNSILWATFVLELVENCFQAVVKHRFIVVTQWAERMVIGSIEFHSVNTYRVKVCIKSQVRCI